MKWIILIVCFQIIPFKSICQQTDYLKKISINDTLRIEYIAGDESIEFNKIEIFISENRLFVKRKGKTLYVGNKAEKHWTKNINEENRKQINEFIFESTQQKNGEYWSSWREEYLITINNDTISNLIGNHDWGIENYYSFEEQLFKEEFQELVNKRNKLDKSIAKELEGEWIIIGNLENIKRGEKIKLKRRSSKDEICIWIFGKEKKFKSRCSEIDLEYSKEFSLDIDEGDIYMDIESGWKKRILKFDDLKNDGASFKILKIENDIINLEFMWR